MAMLFLWHHALWLLIAVPMLAGTYVVLTRRQSHQRLRYVGLGLTGEPSTFRDVIKRHLPALLLFAGVSALLLALARPVLVTSAPAEQGTVVLLMDVSLSMAATDVPPTRLDAARAAALEFVRGQPKDVRVGVVAFGGNADVVQPPTTRREDVIAALHAMELQRFTAIGNGLMAALLTIDPTADVPSGYDIFGIGRAPPGFDPSHADDRRVAPVKTRKTYAPGSYLSAAIVLVSDGHGTMGVPALDAAKRVADHGVRVFTIGVGTLYGGVANVEGWAPIHAEFDETMLQKIADVTDGEYFLARSADKVRKIYQGLGRRVIFERSEHEVTAIFTALGMLLAVAGAALSLLSYRTA
jgi:Ca-activated chloride channel family protein